MVDPHACLPPRQRLTGPFNQSVLCFAPGHDFRRTIELRQEVGLKGLRENWLLSTFPPSLKRMTGAPSLPLFWGDVGGDRWSPFSRIKSFPAKSRGMELGKRVRWGPAKAA